MFIPVNKNDNHWFVIVVFPFTKMVLSVDSLNQQYFTI